jgi:glucan phosphorylase
MLAGDHAKSASDLGVGFVGISLFYREGYFQQRSPRQLAGRLLHALESEKPSHRASF